MHIYVYIHRERCTVTVFSKEVEGGGAEPKHPHLLLQMYGESVLTSSITVWYCSCTKT